MEKILQDDIELTPEVCHTTKDDLTQGLVFTYKVSKTVLNLGPQISKKKLKNPPKHDLRFAPKSENNTIFDEKCNIKEKLDVK